MSGTSRPKRRAGNSLGQQKQKTSRRGSSDTTAQSRDVSRASSPAAQSTASFDVEAFFSSLEPVPASVPRMKRLTNSEIRQLEEALEFGPKDSWKDWVGNLDLLTKAITNPSTRGSKSKNNPTQSLIDWAESEPSNIRLVRALIQHVCTGQNIPPSAKKILGSLTEKSSLSEIQETIKRVNHDPQVLREDGWTLEKSSMPVGASGGPFLIGELVFYQGMDAVIIAYIHDQQIGDLWKCMKVDEHNCFDLELEEIMEAKRRYSRRYEQSGGKVKRSAQTLGTKGDFTVKGINYGIVLAGSYSKGARQGVYWPARVRHASEYADHSQSKRVARQKVEVVFLAPYWKSDDLSSRPSRKVEALSDSGDEGFSTTPLLHAETIDVADEMIKEFHVDDDSDQLDYEVIQTAFRFTGLPGSYFMRYLDSYRLATALRLYAKTHLCSSTHENAASLFGTHVLATRTAKFPNIVLDLPYWHILSGLRRSFNRTSIGGLSKSSEEPAESIIRIDRIVAAMIPQTDKGDDAPLSPSISNPEQLADEGNPHDWTHVAACMNPAMLEHSEVVSYLLKGFIRTFPALNAELNQKITPSLNGLINGFAAILVEMAKEDLIGQAQRSQRSMSEQKARLNNLIRSWVSVKNIGEDCLAMSRPRSDLAIVEWRRACLRTYNFILDLLTCKGLGKGFSIIVTDFRCNGHMTSDGCFERMVRLPAAMKGVRLAIDGAKEAARIVQEVPDEYLAFVEREILPKTHDPTYLERMKSRCLAPSDDDEVIMLTEDSEGEGGEDTMGSTGTWTAALCAVASAVYAVDLVVKGECVNAFCATRPPGHHAGRRLHPMKAVSNGFCILNAVASAAIYAALPVAMGGVGLRRVCIIDFDVHHGNGTQDILCSTYDPRFLYISIHAGGSEVNGNEFEGVGPKSTGIYPGRCGDTSPHTGVLNIPLGLSVTPHGVGTALLQRINPRVDKFCPDLIIVSAGFDAHKNDPMSLGSLRSDDFFTITDSICSMARKHCNGRLVSVMEGGYGVPCCRPQRNLFLPASEDDSMNETSSQTNGKTSKNEAERKQPSALADLGSDLPDDMDDQVPYPLQGRLEKCHEEGFVECVKEHVRALLKNNRPS